MNRYKFAKALADKGFRIFPLKPNDKTPLNKGWQKAAAADATPWVNGETYNIGMVADDKFLFVDVDMKHGVDGEASWAKLGIAESQLQVRTPTGGRHIIYSLPEGENVANSASTVADGVDIRGNGGYVVAIGSEIGGVMYKPINMGAEIMEAPEELIALCKKKKQNNTKRDTQVITLELNRPEYLVAATEYLQTAPVSIEGAGGDENAFMVAAQVRDMGVGETSCIDLMAEHWNFRCSPPWSPNELATKVRNAYAYAQGKPGSGTPEVQFADEPDSAPIVKLQLSCVERMNQNHALVAIGTSHVIIEEYTNKEGRPMVFPRSESTFHRMTVADIYTDQNGKLRQVSKDWITSPDRRTYLGFTFDPRHVGPVDEKYNHWRGNTYKPTIGVSLNDAKALCDLFLRHLRDIICGGDVELYRWMINHFAQLVQFPWKKPETAIVIIGKKGAGKSLVFDVIGHLFKDNYIVTAEKRMLLGNFNSHMETVLVFQFEEAFWAGDKAAEGKLKHMITGKCHMVEHKGYEPYMVDNYARIYITSNSDWAVPATVDERRFAVMECSPDRIGDKPYFKDIFDQLERNGGEGYRALMTVLSEIEVDQVAVNVPPKTAALADQKLETLEGPAKWLYSSLAEGCIAGVSSEVDYGWLNEVPCNEAYEAYHLYDKSQGNRYPRSDRSFGRALQAMLGDAVKRTKKRVGHDFRYVYKFKSLDECRENFNKWFGHDLEW
jgi:hypothetical protein